MTELTSLLALAALVTLVGSAAAGIAASLVAVARQPAISPLVADGPSSTVASRAEMLPRVAPAGVVVAFALLAGALVARALTVGHAPWSNLHEFSLAFAAALVGAHALLARRHPMDGLAPLTAGLAAGLVGFALSLDDRVDPLVPALQQPILLTVHVGSAALAYAVAGIAFVAALAEIAQAHARDGIPGVPSAAALRTIGHRAVLLAFPILTLAIVLGSVWANLAWRSYWSNDPKELAAAATWLVFGAYLHVAGRRDRWGGLAAWLIVLGFAGVLFTYIGAGLFIIGEHGYGQP
jgi:cytochrome c-type biogenesis protein CcsB